MRAAALLLVILSGCAAQPPAPSHWGRLDGAPASDTDRARFRQDEAACEYDQATLAAQRAAYGVPRQAPVYYGGDPAVAAGFANLAGMAAAGPPSGMFELCMRSRGWAQKG